jgi:hypothetical protein
MARVSTAVGCSIQAQQALTLRSVVQAAGFAVEENAQCEQSA